MVVALLSKEHEEGSRLGAFAGLGHRNPWLAAAMTIFLLSLAGLPPTAGFTAKILILASTVGAGYAWLAGLLVVGTAISIYVYLKIVFAMYARTTGAHPVAWAATSRGSGPWISPISRSSTSAL